MKRKLSWNFIDPEPDDLDMKKKQPASYIRKVIRTDRQPLQVTMYATALGCYIPFCNGKRIGDDYLRPGFTNYHVRLQYQTYDLTETWKKGDNVVGCILGDGWYRGCLGAFSKRNNYGERTALALNLVIQYEDGEEVITTDEFWKASQDGALRQNDLKMKEYYDATRENGWLEPDFDDQGFRSCRRASYDGQVIPEEGEKLSAHETFLPEVLTTPDGSTVLDFGQNMSGMIRFEVTGPRGHEAALIFGEVLDEQGNFTLKNLEGKKKEENIDPETVEGLGQKLIYRLKEGRQTYASMFLICGFRYVKLKNWPEAVAPEHFTAIAVYSDLRQTGSFRCSNETINRFVQNVIWSMRSNFVDIPTDCPQRERAGWTADISVFLESGNYLADTRAFIGKWMHDLVSVQTEGGAVPEIAPPVPNVSLSKSVGSAGWSDAIANVPWTQYQCYGDPAVLEENYEAIKKYVKYCRQLAKKNHIKNIFKRRPSREYVIDTGFHYGEWLEPGSSNLTGALNAMFKPDEEVTTAWFYYTTSLLAQMAGILGRKNDEAEYQKLSGKIKEAYRQEFLGSRLQSKRPCKYVRPLYMGLADPEEEKELAGRLDQLCIENHDRIGTGFLTTYQILNVLTDYGYVDTAYHMMENEDCPGSLYEVLRGATTVWEGWDAVGEDGTLKTLSLNHYAPGAALSWLFSRCAGIRAGAPGYQKILIEPHPGGTLTFADASYQSPVGLITSAWEIRDGRFELHVTLPEHVLAVIVMPDQSRIEEAVSGIYSCDWK